MDTDSSDNPDFTRASSSQLELVLCRRLEQARMAQNITQKQLAQSAGVSLRTVIRMKKGEGISLDTFIRIVKALDLQENLYGLFGTDGLPVKRARSKVGARQRPARPISTPVKKTWGWNDDGE